jgi:hypothetical protein
MNEQQKKRGPKPERVKIDGDWQAAMAKALRKPMPQKPKLVRKKRKIA